MNGSGHRAQRGGAGLATLLVVVMALASAGPAAAEGAGEGEAAGGQIRLSELMLVALPGGPITDEDGDSVPWVELFNPSAAEVNLGGWFLTDDPERLTRWRFPPVVVPPRGYLVVNLSGKNRREPGRPLHTSFRLKPSDEALLLVRPDGTTRADGLEAPWPTAHRGISFGFQQHSSERELLGDGARCEWFVPVRGREEPGWQDPAFEPARWFAGILALGFDTKPEPTFGERIRTNIERQMRRIGQSVFIRVPFQAQGERIDLLRLDLEFEDGFAAFLNGTQVASANAPHPTMLHWDSGAADWQRDAAAERLHQFDIPDFHRLLHEGDNLLALQGLTFKIDSRDMVIAPRLVATTLEPLEASHPCYLASPTPGRPNGGGLSEVVGVPRISLEGGIYRAPFQVELASDEPGVQVRYTTDGSEPGPDSPLAAEPIPVEHSLRLRARAFGAGKLPSSLVEESYVLVAEDLWEFDSNLPIVCVDSSGTQLRPKSYRSARIEIHDVRAGGRSRLSDTPEYSGRCGIQMRGSSTLERDKKAYSVELRDEEGRDAPAAILGLPADSDWILYAPYNFDQAGIRNALVYELSNRMGRYAPRTRFCEVFVNTEAGKALSRDSYAGLYLLMEKIARGKSRVDVERLDSGEDSLPEVAGGYILKIDRPGPDDAGFRAGYQKHIQHVYPKERHITRAQSAWIREYLDAFGRALASPGFADPETGYARYIDVDSFVDFHLMQEFAKNPDAYTLSTVFHKRRDGKLQMGPLWDFDRAMRTNDRAYWVGSQSDPESITDVHDYGWWGQLFRDPEFLRRYRARGRELRGSVLSTEAVCQLIDEMAAEIAEAKQRDDDRWKLLVEGEWEAEIERFKGWIALHGTYLDARYIQPPRFESSTGAFVPPCTLTLVNPPESGDVYTMLDGTNPASGSEPREGAIRYEGPFEVTRELVVRARVRTPEGQWSGHGTTECVLAPPTLTITEIMFQPMHGSHLEFVELYNYGEEPVALAGLDFWWGIGFSVPRDSFEILLPGEYVAIARHPRALRSYRPGDYRILGPFEGSLNDYGERLRLHGGRGELITDLYFAESWVPEAEGDGYSMVLTDPTLHGDRLNDPAVWRASYAVGGSPGMPDLPVVEGPGEK